MSEEVTALKTTRATEAKHMRTEQNVNTII